MEMIVSFFGDKLKLMKNLDMDVIDIPEIALIFLFFLILGYINEAMTKLGMDMIGIPEIALFCFCIFVFGFSYFVISGS